MLASQWLEISQGSFRLTDYSFPYCKVIMIIVESRFIHSKAGVILDSLNEYSCLTTLKTPNLEEVQVLHADSRFRLSEASSCCALLVKGKNPTVFCAQLMQFSPFNRQKIDRMSGEVTVVRYFELMTSVTNVHRVFSCLCSRWAADERCDHTVSPSKRVDEFSDLEERCSTIQLQTMSASYPKIKLMCTFSYLADPVSFQSVLWL